MSVDLKLFLLFSTFLVGLISGLIGWVFYSLESYIIFGVTLMIAGGSIILVDILFLLYLCVEEALNDD